MPQIWTAMNVQKQAGWRTFASDQVSWRVWVASTHAIWISFNSLACCDSLCIGRPWLPLPLNGMMMIQSFSIRCFLQGLALRLPATHLLRQPHCAHWLSKHCNSRIFHNNKIFETFHFIFGEITVLPFYEWKHRQLIKGDNTFSLLLSSTESLCFVVTKNRTHKKVREIRAFTLVCFSENHR